MTSTTRSGPEALAAGIDLGQRGEYEASLTCFEEALQWAEGRDPELWDRVYCNRSVAEIELGRCERPLGELRRIVLRRADDETGFLAAYTVARAYDLRDDYKRALFYGGIARDRALRLQRRDWLSWSYNLLANLRLSQSYFADAVADYELALKLVPVTPSVARALMLDNLAYCRFIEGEYRDGFRLVFESLRTLQRFRAHRFRAGAAITLAFGYLEIGKLDAACRQAQTALRFASDHDDDEAIKKAHYLLGEIYHQLGQDEEARRAFTRLQQTYYPEANHLPELLMSVDVRSLLNLKA